MKEELEIKDKAGQPGGLKIAPFRPHIRKTTPHKHNNYFEIIYLTKGKGWHTIDTKEYEIKPPVIFTVRKEQVHFWDIKTKPEGFVLIIKKSYIDNCLDNDLKGLLSALSAQTCLFPKDNTTSDFFQILLHEHENKNPNRPLIDGLLKALLAKILESATPASSKNGNNSIFQKFIQLLSRENELSNKVKHYAQKLNITPQNLNAICRKETGQSSNDLISDHIINEAKRLLLYTDATISEIAHRLNFKDNSHFTKYFKRHVEQTPMNFRNDSD
ncbi:AraC family transcriptional regulator [Zunongwangia sp. H14]|uniref:AraC family transcriptional regulator n=1 Tax=Zunongwangia sp. H14 TaxID=3240792 RepID=UPI0035634B5C